MTKLLNTFSGKCAKPITYGLCPSYSARKVAKSLTGPKSILGLACGRGTDEMYLAGKGFRVTALDINQTNIRSVEDEATVRGIDIRGIVADIRKHLPIKSGSYDAVYMRLGLHYFSDRQLPHVISEIKRVLRPGGFIFVTVKSKEDFYYLKYSSTKKRDGMIRCLDLLTGEKYWRRFFDSNDLSIYFGSDFNIIQMSKHQEKLYRDAHVSSLLLMFAQKTSS